jgi:hypothetical protein
VVIILWCLAALSLARIFLPPLLHLIGFNRYRIRADVTSADPKLGDTDAFSEEVQHQLQSFGFHFLGSMTETHWFVGIEWTHSTQFRVFSQPAHQCYACLYRPLNERPVRVALATVFTPMALVWTSNSALDPPLEQNDFVREQVPSNDLSPILRHHREVVRRFVADGKEPAPVDTLEPLLAAGRRYAAVDHRYAKSQLGAWLRTRLIWLGVALVWAVCPDFNLVAPCLIMADGILATYQTKQAYKLMAQQRAAEVGRLGLPSSNNSADGPFNESRLNRVTTAEETGIKEAPRSDSSDLK